MKITEKQIDKEMEELIHLEKTDMKNIKINSIDICKCVPYVKEFNGVTNETNEYWYSKEKETVSPIDEIMHKRNIAEFSEDELFSLGYIKMPKKRTVDLINEYIAVLQRQGNNDVGEYIEQFRNESVSEYRKKFTDYLYENYKDTYHKLWLEYCELQYQYILIEWCYKNDIDGIWKVNKHF
ncbi:MAG TPA: hypothetical protein PK854_12515 [Oscillospiraceae bacterium]|nr:hypothetical protein [Oscillospiraceae bacterium]HPS36074.1 hypothetical protein [Oscillospiraceae bacterium]